MGSNKTVTKVAEILMDRTSVCFYPPIYTNKFLRQFLSIPEKASPINLEAGFKYAFINLKSF